MEELVLCTQNPGKVAELRMLMRRRIRLRHLGELGVNGPLPEYGTTFEENAVQKANYGFSICRSPCLADDSGLEVHALNGAPGVHSAHYAGHGRNDEANIDLLLQHMAGIMDRRARFRTVLAYTDGRECRLFEGVVHGHILTGRRGTGGFGYDAIFVPQGDTRTYAEMEVAEKNLASHRSQAFKQFLSSLGER